MSSSAPTEEELAWLAEAYQEAQKGLRGLDDRGEKKSEVGLPIGAVLVDPREGKVVARGHNLRVQTGDPTAHAEVVCVRNAGRRTDWSKLVLVSTLSPCIMCTGTTLLYKIPRVVVGENKNFDNGFAEKLMKEQGVKVTLVQDPKCIEMMAEFVENNPKLWNEDIGVKEDEP